MAKDDKKKTKYVVAPRHSVIVDGAILEPGVTVDPEKVDLGALLRKKAVKKL